MVTHKQIVTSGFMDVMEHIEKYVIRQYGDYEGSPVADYSTTTCIEHAQRYLARHGRSSRPHEEERDILKTIHYLVMALYKAGAAVGIDDIADDISFASTPESIDEIRSAKTGRGADWTPRSALINVLRRLDTNDIKIDELIILRADYNENRSVNLSYTCATSTYLVTMGLLEAGKVKIAEDSEL